MTPVQAIFLIVSTLLTTVCTYVVVQTLVHFCCRSEEPSISRPNAKSVSKSASPSNDSASKQTTNIPALKPTSKEYIFFRNSTITCCGLFAIQIVMTNVDYFILALAQSDAAYKAASIVCWVFYFMGHMTLLLIFIARLKYTFEDTPFSYSKRTIHCLIFIWSLMPFFSVTAVIVITFGGGSRGATFVVGVSCAILFVSIDIVLSCILLYFYLQKLYILLNVTNGAALMAITTKMTLLYTICYVSTIICFFIISIRAITRTQSDESGSFLRVIFMFLSVDAWLNMLCLWLKLTSAKNVYSKLCQSSHNMLQKCCRRCNKTTVDMDQMAEAPAGSEVELSPEMSIPQMADLDSFEVRTTQNTAIIL